MKCFEDAGCFHECESQRFSQGSVRGCENCAGDPEDEREYGNCVTQATEVSRGLHVASGCGEAGGQALCHNSI
jgi:hypothetical protein